jgi:uncharacterized protein YigE (DUF2233 family)
MVIPNFLVPGQQGFARPHFLFAMAVVILGAACSLPAETLDHKGTSYWIYRLKGKESMLELHLSAKAGEPHRFPDLAERVAAQGRRLTFALNSGIFEPGFLPSGLHIAEGKTIVPLNLKEFIKTNETDVTPNFFLKPNGVFFLRNDGTAAVVESSRYATLQESPRIATQSGPLLVAGGQIHPAFNADSTSKRYRNGVGVTASGEVIFACSILDRELGLANLHSFATLFRDALGCPDALYLDGDISYIFIEGQTESIRETNWFGGIFAITEPISPAP